MHHMKNQMLIIGLITLFFNSALAQRGRDQNIPLIGSQAPAFKSTSTKGPVSFPDDFGKDWKILFAHPRDFTPVCSSEILELAYRQEEFKALGAHIIVISVDRMASHQNWKADLEEINYKGRGQVSIDFPLVVDSSAVISRSYGMIDPRSSSGQSIRGVFFVSPENEIRAFYFYPNEVGRNTDEILRTLKALKTHYENENTVIPANWQPGDDVMIPILTKEDKEELTRPDSKVHFINWYMIYRKQE
jgi:peroxiredoxin 2/4